MLLRNADKHVLRFIPYFCSYTNLVSRGILTSASSPGKTDNRGDVIRPGKVEFPEHTTAAMLNLNYSRMLLS